jgi:PAS domain S-box-containing protein
MKNLRINMLFILLFLLPLLLFPFIQRAVWHGSSEIHAILEFSSSLVAITAGIMVLVHFFITGRIFFLIISCGLIMSGGEEFVHSLFALDRIWPAILPAYKLAASTSWLGGNTVLLITFLVAIIFGNREIARGKRRLYAVVFNSSSFIITIIVAILIFKSEFLSDFIIIGSDTKKYIELTLIFLFAGIFLTYFREFVIQQPFRPLMPAIIAFIILRIMVHFYLLNSQAAYDSLWDSSHLLVLLSNFSPIFGIWGETIKLHKFSELKAVELAEEMEEHRKASEALNEREGDFQQIFENNSAAMVLIEPDLSISNVNEKFCSLSGYKKQEVIGMNGARYVPTEYLKRLKSFNNQEAINTRDYLNKYEFTFYRKDGEISHAISSFAILNNHRFIASFVDISDRKKAEENLGRKVDELRIVNRELEEYTYANQELKQFAYTASHQLQEPIRTVTNYSRIIEEDYSGLLGEEGLKHLQTIEDATSRMAKLIDSLLEYSRLGRNRKLVHSDCRKLIDNVISDLKDLIIKSKAEIEVTAMPSLSLYEVEIRQLFQNLITNAIKFQKKNTVPKIRIHSEKMNDKWKFSVSDNGIGIAPEHYEKIFEIFQRLHSSEEEYEGKGIGLAYCRKIVHIHQGEIWVESRLGEGTTFYFTIPE